MSWRATARAEVRALRAAAVVRGLLAVAALTGVAAVTLPAIAIGTELTAEGALPFLVAPLKLLVGAAGLLLGHGAVAGPRSGGQLKLALGLPIDRRAFVLGTYLGRAAATLLVGVVALAAAAVAMWVLLGAVAMRGLVGLSGALAPFGVAVAAVGVGLSAASRGRGAAAVAAVGALVLFQFFWGVVPAGAHYLVEGSLPGPAAPPWIVFLERAQPFAAFEVAAEHAVPEAGRGVRLSGAGASAGDTPSTGPGAPLAGSQRWYLEPRVAVALLVGWTVLPLVIGAERFRRTDL